jgi:tetratricopeptide (TPR) repeat protein
LHHLGRLSASDWIKKASALMGANNQGAVEAFTKAIELDPKNARAYGLRAIAYYEQGNYQQAIKDCDRAIALDPKKDFNFSGGLYCCRGLAYEKLGNYRHAIKDYDRAIELNPKFALAYYNRGLA